MAWSLHMCVTRASTGHRLLCAVHCMSFTMKALTAAALATLEQHRGCVTWGYVMATLWLWLLLWLLRQPGERLCYGRWASQERINLSAVPTAPWIFFQLLSSQLAYPGFSKQHKQCEQQDNWHHKQGQHDIVYMWNLKYDTNELIYEIERLIDGREHTCGCQGEGMGEGWIGSLGLADANCYM